MVIKYINRCRIAEPIHISMWSGQMGFRLPCKLKSIFYVSYRELSPIFENVVKFLFRSKSHLVSNEICHFHLNCTQYIHSYIHTYLHSTTPYHEFIQMMIVMSVHENFCLHSTRSYVGECSTSHDELTYKM